MTDGQPAPQDPGEELRQVEARLEARIQEIAARLVLNDGRFAALTDRLNEAGRRADATATWMDSSFATIDRRFDTLDTRLDTADTRLTDTHHQLIDRMREHRAALGRTTILGLTATFLATGLLIASTMWLVF